MLKPKYVYRVIDKCFKFAGFFLDAEEKNKKPNTVFVSSSHLIAPLEEQEQKIFLL